MTQLEQLLEKAINASNDTERQSYYMSILDASCVTTETSMKIKEEAYGKLSQMFVSQNNDELLSNILINSLSYFENIPKAKGSKLIRQLTENFCFIKNPNLATQTHCVTELVNWSKRTNQTFLKQWLEMFLTEIYSKDNKFTEALGLINGLLGELKKLDDKINSVEVLLLQSEVYYKIRNLAKSKSALTAARTTANSVYCPQKLQAKLDMQSGILNCEDNDYKTGFSYFYEAFEAYDTMKHPNAELMLKYMLLCKIMMARFDEFTSAVNSKLAVKYSGKMTDTMKQLNKAYENRSIKEFELAFSNNKEELEGDKIVYHHLRKLYESLMEQNIIKIIEPYSHIEIDHIASLMELDNVQIENKLSQMILDKLIDGVIDMENNCLEINPRTEKDQTYQNSLETLKNMGHVVDHLVIKAAKLG